MKRLWVHCGNETGVADESTARISQRIHVGRRPMSLGREPRHGASTDRARTLNCRFGLHCVSAGRKAWEWHAYTYRERVTRDMNEGLRGTVCGRSKKTRRYRSVAAGARLVFPWKVPRFESHRRTFAQRSFSAESIDCSHKDVRGSWTEHTSIVDVRVDVADASCLKAVGRVGSRADWSGYRAGRVIGGEKAYDPLSRQSTLAATTKTKIANRPPLHLFCSALL